MGNSSQQLSQYICIDNDNKDKCTNMAMYLITVIITRYLPLIMAPFVSCLSIVYIYPVIYFQLKQHLRKVDNSFYTKQGITLDSDEQKVKVAEKWKALHLQGLY